LSAANFADIFSRSGDAAYTGSTRSPTPEQTYIYRKEGVLMKIVVLRSPAILAPILRRMFGIRKEKRR
jgi:hypothetical protein